MKHSKTKNTFEELDKSFNTKEITKALESNLKKTQEERQLPAVDMSDEDKQALIKIYNEYNHNNKVIPIQLQEYITSLHKDIQLDKYSESSGDPLNEYKKVLLVASILRRQSLGISKINAINMSAKYFNISPKIYFDIFDIYLSKAERFLMVEPDIRGLDKLLGVN